MRLLLDTHLLLWATILPRALSETARTLITDPDAVVMFSAVSIWEVTIKYGLGRGAFDVDPRVLRRALSDHGYIELPVTSEHAVSIIGLPSIHGDPFDRLLLAQAISEGIILLTADRQLAQYPGPVRLV